VKHDKNGGFIHTLKEQYRTKRSTFVIFASVRAIVIISVIRQAFIGNYENTFLCVLTLGLLFVPSLISHTFKVELPTLLENIVLIFIFAAQVLGELNDYYVKYPLWDSMLHTVTGFLAAAVGLSLIDILNRSDEIELKLSPLFTALVAFCFSMTIAVLWEFMEFSCDVLLRTDMQKDTVLDCISSVMLNPDAVNTAVKLDGITDTLVNGKPLGVKGYLDIGLYDTMKDMFVNFIGAVSFSVFGLFYTKRHGKAKASRLVDGLKLKRK